MMIFLPIRERKIKHSRAMVYFYFEEEVKKSAFYSSKFEAKMV
jgi:hypothetical protein